MRGGVKGRVLAKPICAEPFLTWVLNACALPPSRAIMSRELRVETPEALFFSERASSTYSAVSISLTKPAHTGVALEYRRGSRYTLASSGVIAPVTDLRPTDLPSCWRPFHPARAEVVAASRDTRYE